MHKTSRKGGKRGGQNVLNSNQNCRRRKKRKNLTQNKTLHTHTQKNKMQLLLFYEFKDEDAFFKVGSVLRQVVYMICGYCLCLPVSMSQVPCFLQVTLSRQWRQKCCCNKVGLGVYSLLPCL